MRHVLLLLALATPTLAANPSLAWWQDARFGMFIHWGPVSLQGTEIGWSRGGERRGRPDKSTGSVPVDVYDNLYKQFNPVDFDADEWVQIALDAGMKYLVFTTKHHDGFTMFDSQLTDYDIIATPYGRDIVKQLADACHDKGLKLGWYYSPPDWHHPDYRTERHAEYIKYLHGQLRELCTNYGQVDMIWFDGLGGTSQDWDSEPLHTMIRELQPGILINNRGGLPGDFVTPEQKIGGFNREQPWETCMTICRQWAWKPNDQLKSLDQCLHTLIRCAGGDGNLLFNVGPMPTGAIEPRQVDRLREMGAWLKTHGESIYGTRGGPYKPGPKLASTCRGRTIYLHLLDKEALPITLPAMPAKVMKAELLGGVGEVKVTQSADALVVDVPAASLDPVATTIVMTIDRDALDIPVMPTWSSGSLALGKPATASNVFQKQTAKYGPQAALDDDEDTRWATDGGTHAAELTIDFGVATSFASVEVLEAFDRVRDFELQVPDGDGWRTIHHGTTIGEKLRAKFEPVTASQLRLKINEATDGPTIWEVRVFGP